MAEYIDRQAAISILNAKSDMALGTPKQCFAAAAAILEKLPAADVVEVRHGKNLSEDDPSRFECSECGWKCWDTYCGDTITYSFCPNCGAKMDMEE